MTRRNGCFDRPPFKATTTVADGWETTWARRMVDMEFRQDRRCMYSRSDLGKADQGCDGCIWRATEKANDELPELPAMEAERKRRDAEARIRALHEKWPGSQIYSPNPSLPATPDGDIGRDSGPCGVVGTTE